MLIANGHDEEKISHYSIPKFFTYIWSIEEHDASKTASQLNTMHLGTQGTSKDINAAVKTLMKKKKKGKARVK